MTKVKGLAEMLRRERDFPSFEDFKLRLQENSPEILDHHGAYKFAASYSARLISKEFESVLPVLESMCNLERDLIRSEKRLCPRLRNILVSQIEGIPNSHPSYQMLSMMADRLRELN